MELIIDQARVALEDDSAPCSLSMQVFNTGRIYAPTPVQDNTEVLLGLDLTWAGKGVSGRLPQLLPVGRAFKKIPRPVTVYPATYTEIIRMVQVVEPGQCIVLRAHAVVTALGYANPALRFMDRTDPTNWTVINSPTYFLSENPESPTPYYTPTANRELDTSYVWKVPANVSGPRIITLEIATGSMTLREVCLMGA